MKVFVELFICGITNFIILVVVILSLIHKRRQNLLKNLMSSTDSFTSLWRSSANVILFLKNYVVNLFLTKKTNYQL